MSVLHEIGADLGDPVQVSLSDDRVQVRGVGVAPERQAENSGRSRSVAERRHSFLRSSLRRRCRMTLPRRNPPPPRADSPNAFQARLEAQLGGRGPVDRFTGQVLNWNESAMAHAYALRLLAQQFPSDASHERTGSRHFARVGSRSPGGAGGSAGQFRPRTGSRTHWFGSNSQPLPLRASDALASRRGTSVSSGPASGSAKLVCYWE